MCTASVSTVLFLQVMSTENVAQSDSENVAPILRAVTNWMQVFTNAPRGQYFFFFYNKTATSYLILNLITSREEGTSSGPRSLTGWSSLVCRFFLWSSG